MSIRSIDCTFRKSLDPLQRKTAVKCTVSEESWPDFRESLRGDVREVGRENRSVPEKRAAAGWRQEINEQGCRVLK